MTAAASSPVLLDPSTLNLLGRALSDNHHPVSRDKGSRYPNNSSEDKEDGHVSREKRVRYPRTSPQDEGYRHHNPVSREKRARYPNTSTGSESDTLLTSFPPRRRKNHPVSQDKGVRYPNISLSSDSDTCLAPNPPRSRKRTKSHGNPHPVFQDERGEQYHPVSRDKRVRYPNTWLGSDSDTCRAPNPPRCRKRTKTYGNPHPVCQDERDGHHHPFVRDKRVRYTKTLSKFGLNPANKAAGSIAAEFGRDGHYHPISEHERSGTHHPVSKHERKGTHHSVSEHQSISEHQRGKFWKDGHKHPMQNENLHHTDRYLHFVSISKEWTKENHHYVSINEIYEYHRSDSENNLPESESQEGANESMYNDESESENEENFITEERKDVKIKYEQEDHNERDYIDDKFEPKPENVKIEQLQQDRTDSEEEKRRFGLLFISLN